MTRPMRPLITAAVAALALAGCGSSKPQGYYNMKTLDSDLTVEVGQRMFPTTPNTVNCIRAGQTATCLVSLSNGQSTTMAVTIAKDGKSYIAQ